MSAIVFDLLASHRDILTESPREGSYLSAAVLRSDYPEYIPNRYLSKGQIISTSALEWLRQFGSLRSHDKEELGVLIPHPGPDASEASHPGPALAAIDIAATYVRLNKFNFSDLALLAGFVKASGTKDWRFTSSDAGGFLREHGVDTSNLSSALKSLSSDREGKSKDGDVSDVVERKIRNVEAGLWEFTPTGIKHVHDLLQHHGAFDPNSTHSFS